MKEQIEYLIKKYRESVDSERMTYAMLETDDGKDAIAQSIVQQQLFVKDLEKLLTYQNTLE